MRRILITGGAGFVGSHLAERLLADGNEVTVIDDLSTGTIRNLEAVRAHDRLRVVVDSIMNQPLMAELVDWCDEVYHLAAAVGVRLVVERPVHTIETNIRGTEIVLGLASQKGRKVLITSTSEVYGKSERVPFREDDDLVLGATIRPRWGYACSKAIDEFLALAHHREFGTPVVIVRLFNTVGPRQTGQYGMVIPRFAEQALRGEPITVYGAGTQTRAFGHVSDVVCALVSLMGNVACVGQVFNVGNTREITILALAEMVRGYAQSTSAIECIPFEQAYDEKFEDLVRRVPCLDKLTAAIGYAPVYCIEEIVQQVVEFERDRLGIA